MAKTVSATNPAPVSNGAVASVDTTGWEDERVGFAPYIKIKEGSEVVCKIDMKDLRNADFERYVFVAMHDTDCHRGPVEGGEDVMVRAGETFSMNVFESLEPLFDEYLMSGIRPRLKLTAKEKVKTSTEGRKVWLWNLQVHPEDKKALVAYRTARDAKRLAAPEQSRSLEA